jgi:hypothetical protein
MFFQSRGNDDTANFKSASSGPKAPSAPLQRLCFNHKLTNRSVLLAVFGGDCAVSLRCWRRLYVYVFRGECTSPPILLA